MQQGNIHSIETCGTVDGPGIRYVLFTQGCLLRCQFCHNPDTWEIGAGNVMNVEDIMKDIESYRPFMDASGGGVTASGGEPLLQIPFLTELFKACRAKGIHTAIDSSGGNYAQNAEYQAQFDELLKYTDLVLVDLKHINRDKHKRLTGKYNDHILKFAQHLSDKNIPVWIRHVLIPGITDIDEYLDQLGEFIGTLNNVERVEVLPYHKLGVYKWEALNLKYPLEGVEPPTDERVANAHERLTRHFTERITSS